MFSTSARCTVYVCLQPTFQESEFPWPSQAICPPSVGSCSLPVPDLENNIYLYLYFSDASLAQRLMVLFALLGSIMRLAQERRWRLGKMEATWARVTSSIAGRKLRLLIGCFPSIIDCSLICSCKQCSLSLPFFRTRQTTARHFVMGNLAGGPVWRCRDMRSVGGATGQQTEYMKEHVCPLAKTTARTRAAAV